MKFDKIIVDKNICMKQFNFSNLPIIRKNVNIKNIENDKIIFTEKKGYIIKEVPLNYAQKGYKHFSIINGYNCIFDCQYCYLKGYMKHNSVVSFVNFDYINKEIQKCILKNKNKKLYFHTGEYNDPLIFDKQTLFYKNIYDNFKNITNVYFEFRTKNVNLDHILKTKPSKNIIISFSLNPEKIWEKYEKNTPHPLKRLQIAEKLIQKGFQVGFRFDPIIFESDFEKIYIDFLENIFQNKIFLQLHSISLGVFRLPEKNYKIMKEKHFSNLFLGELFLYNGYYTYWRGIRKKIYNTFMKYLYTLGLSKKTYISMDSF